MNKIYKVIWSKTKQRYVVVSELAHSCAKRTGRTLGKSAAAMLAALVLTAGVGVAPVWAAYHEWSTDPQDRGNLTYEFTEDSAPVLSRAYKNVFIGDSWMVESAENNFLYGNGGNIVNNLQWANDNVVFGDNVKLTGTSSTDRLKNALIFGDNVTLTSANTGTIIGDNNYITKADDSLIIGDNVEVVSGKTGSDHLLSTTVIGNNVNIGSREHVAAATGDNITVIGDNVNVDNTSNRTNSSNSLIYGNSVNMTNSQNSVAIGNELAITGTGSENDDNVAIGHSINLGQSGNGHSTGTVAMGDHIDVNGTDNVVIGGDIDLSGARDKVVVLGHKANTTGNQSVAIGESSSSGMSGVAVGGEAVAAGNAAAFGFQAKANAAETTVVGPYSTVNSSYSAALGDHVTIGGNSLGSVAIGGHSSIADNANYAIAIGGSGGGYSESVTTIGEGATAAIAMGYGATIENNSKNSIALGNGASVTFGSTITGFYANGIAIGTGATVSYQNGTAIGTGASAAGSGSIAIGDGAKASVTGTNGRDVIAVGTKATVNAYNGIAIGSDSEIDSNAYGSIAVGYNSKVLQEDLLSNADVEQFLTSLGNNAYRDFNIQFGDKNGIGVFSVGSNENARRVINVARGRISADSTDAINGSQLFGAVQYLDGRIDELANSVGGGEILPDDDNVTIKHPDGETTTGGAGTGGTGSTTPGGSETGSGEGGTGGTGAGSGTTSDNTHYVGLNEDVVLGDTNEDGSFNSGSLTVQKDANGNAITINKEDENGVGDGLVSGLNNTDWDWNKYEQGGYATSNAATEAQLHGAMQGTVQYDRDENGNVDPTNITLNKGGDSVTIHNVARGEKDTDAVNVSQLNEAWDQINNNTTAITNIGNKVGELDSRIDEVGAGAAALAALHPLDFDPDDKWDFAAGYGNYRGENAVAIGAFYRPNEDTMFSVGGTIGNDDNMINAGVSFKIGQGNGVSTSRVAMAKEIKDLRKELEAMKSAMLDVNAGRKLDTSKLQLFPDVPQNHWAYEYVATLAGNGVIEGYPDGNFDGARPMTRYEFAAMLYRAMLNGAKLSDKILTEFAPELERFTVDVVHTDSDGNPTVERVRVVKQNKDTAK